METINVNSGQKRILRSYYSSLWITPETASAIIASNSWRIFGPDKGHVKIASSTLHYILMKSFIIFFGICTEGRYSHGISGFCISFDSEVMFDN